MHLRRALSGLTSSRTQYVAWRRCASSTPPSPTFAERVKSFRDKLEDEPLSPEQQAAKDREAKIIQKRLSRSKWKEAVDADKDKVCTRTRGVL